MTHLPIPETHANARPAERVRAPDAVSPLLSVPIGPDASPCDLLHEPAIGRLVLGGALQALSFAFASGDGDVFTRLIDQSPTAPSLFEPNDFVRDLELGTFVERCLPVFARGHWRPAQSPGYLLRVLASPPRERAHLDFRQRICAELASSPALAERLEELYVRLRQFRDRISRPSVGIQDGIERRLGILHATRAVIECLSRDFAGTTSGLERLHRFGQAIAEGPGYQRLCELLEYEQHRAEVDLRISVGFDGRVRSFQTLEQRENRSNAFYATAFGRLWTRLLLLASGYRASTGELLSRLVDAVFSELEPQVVHFFQLLGDVEVYLAALGFRRLAQHAGHAVCLPEISEHGRRAYNGLFNPWLVAEGRACQPCDLELDERDHLVFITGPNSGGKTRLLQSLCLSQLLGQSGLFVPAAQAELRPVSGLFASLLEHTQPDQLEGRLGTELLRIRHLFERVRENSMIVMDELCSGTNPSEGEALMQLVLDALYELAPQAFITTHFLGFAARLASTHRHRFLQADLDEHEQPTYRFSEGVAKTSLAHRVAERLGITRDSLRVLMLQNNPHFARRWAQARAAALPAGSERRKEVGQRHVGG
jgi:DNA mismatch repair protein MutS2